MAAKMPEPTPGQEKFLYEISRMIPESFWITQLSPQLRVGTMTRVAGKRGIVRLLFMNHRNEKPPLQIGAVVAWEDGSITMPRALLDFLAE